MRIALFAHKYYMYQFECHYVQSCSLKHCIALWLWLYFIKWVEMFTFFRLCFWNPKKQINVKMFKRCFLQPTNKTKSRAALQAIGLHTYDTTLSSERTLKSSISTRDILPSRPVPHRVIPHSQFHFRMQTIIRILHILLK